MIKFHEETLLDGETSESLVIDLQRYISKEDLSDIHGGRFILCNTSDEFKDLLSKSEPWNKLYRKLSSNEFMISCMERLEMSSGVAELNPYLSQRKIPQKLQRIDALKHKRIRETSFIAMSAYLVYSLWNKFCFYMFRLRYWFSKKIQLDILLDVSQSENGYVREIHRDSDSKYIVFLLYLNDLSENGEGGELNLFEYTGELKHNPEPRPAPENCVLIRKIKPTKGKLIIFKNNHEAFHSVSEMSGYEEGRIFCQGAYTVLSGANPNFNKSTRKLKTQWQLFL